MKTKNYIILCVALAAITAATVLLVPGMSDSLEVRLLTFLSTNARG